MEDWILLLAFITALIDGFILGALLGPLLLEHIIIWLWMKRHCKKL